MSVSRGVWRLGRLAGITLQVHWSFLILLAFVGLAHGVDQGVFAGLRGVLFITLLFATIVLHELGHALVARWFGVRTLDITVLPIGGVARLERFPEGALEGLTIALAGPFVSAAIAGALLGGAWLAGGSALAAPSATGPLLVQLGWANLALCAFNLLPAFPMDGGRALRALLVPWAGPLGATRYAAAIGRAVAALLGLVGLLGNPMLVLVAAFLWLQGTAEEQAAIVRHAMRGRTVADALIRDVRAVPAQARVAEVAQLVLHGLQQEFPVLSGDRLVGVVSLTDLVRALAAGKGDLAVGLVARRDLAPVDVDLPLATAHERLLEAGLRALPVTQQGALVGLVGLDTIGGLLAVEGAGGQVREAGAPPVARPVAS